jgi:putative transposase
VLVPYSRISGMVKRRHDRVLTRDSVRQMLGWNHYAFRMRLVHKGRVNGCRVHQVSEHYTSKTCSVCGRFWHGIGGSKVFRCQYTDDCGTVCDRDANGARNIMQMNVTRCLGGGRLVPL